MKPTIWKVYPSFFLLFLMLILLVPFSYANLFGSDDYIIKKEYTILNGSGGNVTGSGEEYYFALWNSTSSLNTSPLMVNPSTPEQLQFNNSFLTYDKPLSYGYSDNFVGIKTLAPASLSLITHATSDNYYSTIRLTKTASDTADYKATTDGQTFGQIDFSGTSNFVRYLGSTGIKGIQDGANGYTQGGYLNFYSRNNGGTYKYMNFSTDGFNIDGNVTSDTDFCIEGGSCLSNIPLSGYVPYTGATENVNLGAHNFTVDTNTLFVDSDNHRVGIGTATPSYAFQVNGSSYLTGGTQYIYNNALVLGSNGTYLASIYINDNAPSFSLKQNNGGTNAKYWDFRAQSGQMNFRTINDAFTDAYNWLSVSRSGYVPTSVTFPYGNIGIGTTSPTYKLHVMGTSYFSSPLTVGSTAEILSSLTATGLISVTDIYTTGSGDDLWLGTSTQSNANFRAYATGEVNIDSDNILLKFGEDQDASIYYDGTNMKIDPQVVGSGYLNILGNMVIGESYAGVDYYLKFDGQTNDGLITWMEDENYFKYDDSILMNNAEEIFFRSTDNKITSNGTGFLDIVSGTSTRIGDGAGGTGYTSFSQKGNLVFVGDASMVFGSMYLSVSEGHSTVSPTMSGWTEVPATLYEGYTNSIDFQNSKELNIRKDGRFKIDWSISALVKGADILHGLPAVNGNLIYSCEGIESAMSKDGDEFINIGGTCISNLSSSDIISMYVKTDSDTSIDIYALNLALTQVGG